MLQNGFRLGQLEPGIHVKNVLPNRLAEKPGRTRGIVVEPGIAAKGIEGPGKVPEGIQLLSLEGIILVKYGPVLPVVKQKPQRQNNQRPRDPAFSYNLLQSFFPNSPQLDR